MQTLMQLRAGVLLSHNNEFYSRSRCTSVERAYFDSLYKALPISPPADLPLKFGMHSAMQGAWEREGKTEGP